MYTLQGRNSKFRLLSNFQLVTNMHAYAHTQPSINSLQGDISYSCPNNGYISGFVSEFTSASSDRTWQPYCCNRYDKLLSSFSSPFFLSMKVYAKSNFFTKLLTMN